MTRIFIEDPQIDEMLNVESIDFFEGMSEVLEDNWDAVTETNEGDWFGGQDPLCDI